MCEWNLSLVEGVRTLHLRGEGIRQHLHCLHRIGLYLHLGGGEKGVWIPTENLCWSHWPYLLGRLWLVLVLFSP